MEINNLYAEQTHREKTNLDYAHEKFQRFTNIKEETILDSAITFMDSILINTDSNFSKYASFLNNLLQLEKSYFKLIIEKKDPSLSFETKLKIINTWSSLLNYEIYLFEGFNKPIDEEQANYQYSIIFLFEQYIYICIKLVNLIDYPDIMWTMIDNSLNRNLQYSTSEYTVKDTLDALNAKINTLRNSIQEVEDSLSVKKKITEIDEEINDKIANIYTEDDSINFSELRQIIRLDDHNVLFSSNFWSGYKYQYVYEPITDRLEYFNLSLPFCYSALSYANTNIAKYFSSFLLANTLAELKKYDEALLYYRESISLYSLISNYFISENGFYSENPKYNRQSIFIDFHPIELKRQYVRKCIDYSNLLIIEQNSEKLKKAYNVLITIWESNLFSDVNKINTANILKKVCLLLLNNINNIRNIENEEYIKYSNTYNEIEAFLKSKRN